MSRPSLLALCSAALVAACATGRQPGAMPVPAASEPEERRASGPAISRYLSARLAESAGDPAAAVDELRLALVHDPDSPQLRIAYAEALARAGRLDVAEAEARRAVGLVQDGTAAATDARVALGKVLALSGRAQAAIDELAAATRIEAALAHSTRREGDDEEDESFDPEPWRALARVRFESGDADGAAAACEALAALDRAEGAVAYRELAARLLDAKKADAARDRLRRAADLAPAEPEGWKLLAQVEESQERFGDARAAWEKALAVDPDDAEALLAAGRLALREGDLEKARRHLGAVLGASPDEVGARLRVTAAWLDAKQPAEALAAASGGGDARLLYLRGVALEQLRRWSDAADAFAAVEPATGELYASARAGLAYALVRAGRPADAVRAARRGLAERPADAALLFALGQAYDRAGQRDAALAQMRSVLAVKPEHAEALNYLGYSYAERGERLEEAQALLERAVALDPENGYYLDSLGWVYFKKGDLERAVETLERADALAGPEPTILDHLGDTYRAARRPVDAGAAYRRALDAAKNPGADDEFTAANRAAVERKLRDLRRHEVRPASAHARDAPAGASRN